MLCSQCEYKESGIVAPATKIIQDESSGFNVLGEGDQQGTLPTVNVNCPKCGHGEAVWWMLQTRSADEPTTQFYRCIKCEHTWRDYS